MIKASKLKKNLVDQKKICIINILYITELMCEVNYLISNQYGKYSHCRDAGSQTENYQSISYNNRKSNTQQVIILNVNVNHILNRKTIFMANQFCVNS